MLFIMQFNKQKFNVTVSPNNVSISDSYRVKSYKDMNEFLERIRFRLSNKTDTPINKRSKFSLINEWRAHNLLYSLGLFKERTGTVDLDEPKWYTEVGYFLLSPFYLHFK